MNQNLNAEQLYTRYAPMVFRRCHKLLGDKSLAADIVQELFVKVLEKRNSLNFDYPSSLLWRMATNMCLNYIRDRKRRGENISCDEIIAQIACTENFERETDNRDILDRLFKRHPESSRTIAVLHFIDGMTLEEVAEEVKMSVAGIRKRLRTLRNSLTKMTEVI